MPLRAFQEIGREFLRKRVFALLLDDPGLGKSLQALSAIGDLGLKRVLCVGSASSAISWKIEIDKWSPGLTFVNLDLGNTFGFDLPGFYFVSYDMLSLTTNRDLRTALRECALWDLLLLDEAQNLKNPGANRVRAIYGDFDKPALGPSISANAMHVWVLSGSLCPNHAGEVYTHLRALFPDVLLNLGTPNQQTFEDKFCKVRDTRFGRVMTGSRNMRVLRDAVQPISLRRKKLDVLPDLKPMEFFTAPIDLVSSMTVLPLSDFNIACNAIEDPFVAESVKDIRRRELGVLKAPGCVCWCVDRLEAGEPKLIVFAWHREVLQTLYDGLLDYDPVMFHGETPNAERSEAVKRFQQDPKTRVFVGQVKAAGTAITLTAARTVFFAEYTSTPGDNYQAASRAHRIGQPNAVQVYFGTVPGSLDERIASAATRKAREIAEIFD